MAAEDHATVQRADLQEQYECASNTRDLSVRSHQAGAVDVLAAHAWSATRLGGALLRLHSQWESAEKPVRQEPRPLRNFLQTLPRTKAEEAHAAEVGLFAAWYLQDMATLIGNLAALPVVREQVTVRAMRWGMGAHPNVTMRALLAEQDKADDRALAACRSAVEAAGEGEKQAAQAQLQSLSEEVAARRSALRREEVDRAMEKATAVIRYWLDQTCPRCHGRKFQVLPGTPALSNRPCPPPREGGCGGSGLGKVPHGHEGRRLCVFLDDCVARGRQALRQRLRQR